MTRSEVDVYLKDEVERLNFLAFHHARPLESVVFGKVEQVSPLLRYPKKEAESARVDHDFYRKLESVVGFYPLFMAVGKKEREVSETGFGRRGMVLFSYNSFPANGVFADTFYIHEVINGADINEKSLQLNLFKPMWSKNDWLKFSQDDPNSVQLLVPQLDLSSADLVTVKSEGTKKVLKQRGFTNVVLANELV